MKIDKYTAQRIKSTARIVDIVSDYTELRKRGSEWEGLCPFHGDRRLGSFKVSEAKNIATCFSCGKVLDPVGFLMEIESIDYPTALRRLAKRYGIYLEGEDTVSIQPTVPVRPKPVELPTLTINRAWVRESMNIKNLKRDNFYNWLTALPWADQQRRRLNDTIWLYALGSWYDWRKGQDAWHTVFWQIDATGNVRSGKLMAYKEDGHRDKATNPIWVHKDPLLHINTKTAEYRSCLFGEHLLKRYPKASAHIVESEKTAIVCAINYGDLERHLWLACGGLQHLKPSMFDTLIAEGRNIYLWPDKDGEAEWCKKAKQIHYDRLGIYTQFLEKNWLPEDGPKADIADIIVRTLQHPVETIAQRYPQLGNLIHTLNLTTQ